MLLLISCDDDLWLPREWLDTTRYINNRRELRNDDADALSVRESVRNRLIVIIKLMRQCRFIETHCNKVACKRWSGHGYKRSSIPPAAAAIQCCIRKISPYHMLLLFVDSYSSLSITSPSRRLIFGAGCCVVANKMLMLFLVSWDTLYILLSKHIECVPQTNAS